MRTELLISFSVGLLVWLLMWVGASYPVVSMVGMMVLSVLFLLLKPRKSNIFLFFGFGILGMTAEAIITKTGAWIYNYPLFFGLPGWLPFAWGILAVIVHDTHHIFHKKYQDEHKDLFVWTECMLYILCITISILFFRSPLVLTLLTFGILAINLKLHHPEEETFFVIYFFIIGGLTEIVGISLHIWSYSVDNAPLQIIWMSLLYSQFALIARRLSLFTEKCFYAKS